ncbi:MAG: AAA family ATPase [Bacteroidales bacterium]|nr:AAA family ATPase [Bacteroidales bacterium]
MQNIEGWPLFVNRLLRTKMQVILTGSNAKLLSSDLATHLTGRSSEINFLFMDFIALL